MISNGEHVLHTCSLKNESCYVFRRTKKVHARGNSLKTFDKNNNVNLSKSYDGDIFHIHADSKSDHHRITLANIEGSPLAVGGYSPNINKAETYDIATNTWIEVANYPYHT